MVKFGADEILNAAGKGFTDEDIDLILRKGEAKTEEQTAKYQQNVQHNLAKFTLLDDTEERNLFEFEGKDYSNKRKDGLVFDMGQRERRPTMNYDVDSYYRSAMKGGTGARGDKEGSTKRPRRLVLPEHQFFNRPRLQQLHEKEQALALKRQARWAFIKELRAGRKAAVAQLAAGEAPEDVARDLEEELNDGRFDLPPEEQEERKALMEEGFKNWSRKDLRTLVTSIERFGRADRASILRETAAETGKDENEVTAYYDTFTARMKELPNWQALQDRIRRGEARIARNKQIKEALERKVAGHKNPLQTLTLNYQGGIGKQQQGRLWTDEEDIFLLILMHKFEYGNWERIRMEIRKSEKFCFDWFFKSRSPQELNKRGDTLIKLIEREYGEAEGGSGRKSYSSQRRNKRKREEEGEAAGEDEEDEDEMEIEDDEMEDEGEEDYGQDEESLASGVVSESTQKSTRSKEGSGMHKKKWSY
ncbi:atpase-like protein [Nannochloropsis gaditana]|nr:atpase-like protein [Nannochloropsis gaditana]